MGYPMTWRRLVSRNGLTGDYDPKGPTTMHPGPRNIAGDMRRLETNSRDVLHLEMYARHAGITRAQAKAVLDAFFEPSLRDALTWEEYTALYQEVHGPSEFVSVSS